MAEQSLGLEMVSAMRSDIATIREQEGRFGAARAAVGNGAILLSVLPYTAGGLETTLATAGAKVYQHADGLPAVAAIGVVAVTVGVVSGAIEAGLTKGLGHTMARLPGAARVLERRKYGMVAAPESETGAAEPQPTVEAIVAEDAVAVRGLGHVWSVAKQRIGRAKQRSTAAAETASLAMGAGSPGIMLRSFADNPRAPAEVHETKGYRTARVLTGVNVVSGAIYGTILTGASTLNGVRSGLGERTVDVLSHPLTWLGLFAVLKAKPWIDNAEKDAWQSIGRRLVFRGDQLEYRELAAQVDAKDRTVREMSARIPAPAIREASA